MYKTLAKFTPIGPRLLVEKIDMGEHRIGRLVIAQSPEGTKQWKPVAVKVIDPGTGRLLSTGERVGPLFGPGQVVILASWRDYGLTIDGDERFIVPEEDVLGSATLTEVSDEAAAAS